MPQTRVWNPGKWRPVWCRHCRGWHEQPRALEQAAICNHIYEKCGLARLIELRELEIPLDPADFPKLSEKA